MGFGQIDIVFGIFSMVDAQAAAPCTELKAPGVALSREGQIELDRIGAHFDSDPLVSRSPLSL